LGLATVEGIVAQSGGYIQVDSVVGRGTSIRILLPFTAEPATKTGSEVRPRPEAGSRGRILVVEDEDPVRLVVMRTLQTEGYEVIGAHEGKEALDELEEIGGGVDLVLSDIVMPGLGGRQLSAELGRRYPGIPIVWMSGHTRESELKEGSVGASEPFLHKPVPPDLLVDTVASVIKGASRTGSH
jgi:CheY-like chemotaxis protein